MAEFNDFTFLNPRGKSVPDYIYCPADHIQFCKLVQVIHVSDIINRFNLDISSIPFHHSMIVTHFNIEVADEFLCIQKDNLDICSDLNCAGVRNKKNVKKIDSNFSLMNKPKF